MEFQAVVLAGSQGNRLYPLCEETPPCLLTISSRPLLHFQLDFLERSGFPTAIVVTRTAFVRPIAAALEAFKATKPGTVTYTVANPMRDGQRSSSAVTSPASSTSSSFSASSSFSSSPFHVQLEHLEGWTGTCSALRHIRHLLHSDFFCLQADLVTNLPLHHLADIHRSRDASLTVTLLRSQQARDPQQNAKKRKEDEEEDHDTHYIGIVDEQSLAPSALSSTSSSSSSSSPLHPPSPSSPISSCRLLYYKSALDLDGEVLSLHKRLLRRCQRLSVHSRLKDAHLYLFAHWVLALLDEKRSMMSVQADLVPYIVKGQYRREMERYREVGRSETQALATQMSHSAPRRESDDVYRCYVYISSDSVYCKRVGSVRAYRDTNIELTSGGGDVEDDLLPLLPTDNAAASLSRHFPRAQLAQSFLSPSVSLPSEQPVSVRRSVVGRGVKIGGGVKCSGSVLMDGVVLEDAVVMTDCVVSEGAVVGKGSSVIACKIGPRYTIQAGSEHKNEVLCHERT